MKTFLMAALFASSMVLAAPAAAQESSYTSGGYATVQGIFLEDGQFENYMDYLAGTYRRSQEFARSQGWISGYRIFANVNRRENEPHLYLMVEMPRLATPQEDVERDRRLNEHLQQTTRQAAEASGQRVSMRRLGGNILLQELTLRSRD